MASTSAVTDKDFEEKVLKATQPVLVDFWAEWCIPCKMISPIVEELSHEYDGKMVFYKLDVDSSPNTALKYNVRSIPTLLIFKNGRAVDQIVGAVPRAVLRKKVDAAVSVAK